VVSDTRQLREAIVGLLALAAAEEEMLLAGAVTGPGSGPGAGAEGPRRWAAAPLVAHNTEFKNQQSERLHALRAGNTPPSYGEIDHTSGEVYARYAAQPAAEVSAASRRVTAELIDGTAALSDEDLLDPARNPWLNGRQLWLQIIVRGFWHPSGHLGEYYAAHGQADRAVSMQEHALATARYLRAPDAAVGMAGYNVACAQAQAGKLSAAAGTLAEAIGLNADLRANAATDPDLEVLRNGGQLALLAGGQPPEPPATALRFADASMLLWSVGLAGLEAWLQD
jgi:hypothetical protein